MSVAHHEHPTPSQYWKIAAFLAAITAVEVAMYYIDQQLELGFLNAAILIVLSTIKFIIVIGWFMHLRFENRLLTRFFTAGFLLACGCYLVVLAALGVVVIRGG